MLIYPKAQNKNTFVKALLLSQAHIGETTLKTNPKNYYYIFGKRDGLYLWDLEKTMPLIRQTLIVLKKIIENKQTILFLRSLNENIHNNVIQQTALKLKQPYLTTKWVGGLLTNCENIQKSFSIKKKKNISLKYLKKKPELLFITNINSNKTAIKEANKMNIPIIAFVNNTDHINGITYPIISNPYNYLFIKFYFKTLDKILHKGV